MKNEEFLISGMSCAACSSSVQKVVSRLEGVKECTVNLITNKMNVTFDENKTGYENFKRVVEKAGFGIEKIIDAKPEKTSGSKNTGLAGLIISAVFTTILLYVSMGQMLFENLPLPFFIGINTAPQNFALTQLLLCLPILYYGRSFFVSGFPLLFRGHPNMDSLIAVGAGASFIYSIVMTYMIGYDNHAVHNLYYESVAVVITLVKLGKFLEAKSRKKTTLAIEKLMSLAPSVAVVIKDDTEFEVPTQNVSVGDILLIKPGSSIPLDGVVIKGETGVDESMLTGESLPVVKTIGSEVFAGSINQNGVLNIKVTKIGNDTELSKIIKFVEDAQGKKAPIAKTADRVAGVFVPIVMAIAIVSSIIWLIVGKDFSFVLKIFTSVLVIACPCALGLATPTAIMVGTGKGATQGFLIRNGEILEITHKVKAVVFDKTGTITVGKATVADVISDDVNTMLKYAVTAESVSTHPLAQAIINYCNDNNITSMGPTDNFQNHGGLGIKCSINNDEIIIGNASLLEQESIDISKYYKDSITLANQGKSIIFVAVDKRVLGVISVTDEIKPSSKDTFLKLKKMGIKTIILSGDNKQSAENVGNQVSSDRVYSNVLPQQKAEIIKEIQKEFGEVMMVGDGINDAPALSTADIGCAVGGGSDIAIETADIVLMKDDITDVYRAIKLSRLTITNIKENLFWAFCYNVICIPVAAGVLAAFGGPLLNPMFAGLAMSFSSVFVVCNALRLKGKKL